MNARARSSCLEVLALAVLTGAGAAQAASLGLAEGASAAGASTASPREADRSGVEPMVVGITLNGSSVADAQLVYRATGAGDRRVWLPVEEAASWRMELAGRARREFERSSYAAFCDASDRCLLDEASALLTITLIAAALLPLRIGPATVDEAAPVAAQSGGYLNYDLSTFRYGRPGIAASVDGHVYSPYGHGALRLDSVYAGGRGSQALGQAVWQIDQPERGRSIQLGSIAIPDAALGPGLPLTGVRIGSNTQLNPTVPLTMRPVVDGLVDRPTRADVFVDGAFRQTAQVPYGPYKIELQPQFAGRGDIEVVSTDATGVQTRVLIPYYQTPTLLAAGATEWSLDAGITADDGSRRYDHAGRPLVASAAVRRGLAPTLTSQAQVLFGRDIARLTLGLDTVDARWGASSLGLAWQKSAAQGRGRVWLAAGQEYVSRDFSASLRTEQLVGRCDAGARDGRLDRLDRACRRTSALLGTSLGLRWSVSAAAEMHHEADGRSGSVATLNARLQLAAFSQIGFSLQHAHTDGRSATVALLTYSRPLGERYAVQTGLQQRDGGRTSLQWVAQKTASLDAVADGPRFQAFGQAGDGPSSVGARWADDASQFAWRGELGLTPHGVQGTSGIAGAFGLAEGRVFASRRIGEAFVLVDAGLPDLPVLLDNREVARTNADGWAVVTGARARQENTVGVDATTLPIQYAMPRDQLRVVPGIAGGALARFDVSDGGVTLPVRDARGERLPRGATVTVSSQALATAVTSRSEIFLDRSDKPADVVVEWGAQRCVLRYEPGAEPRGGYRCPSP